jgi:hypothetical protein
VRPTDHLAQGLCLGGAMHALQHRGILNPTIAMNWHKQVSQQHFTSKERTVKPNQFPLALVRRPLLKMTSRIVFKLHDCDYAVRRPRFKQGRPAADRKMGQQPLRADPL